MKPPKTLVWKFCFNLMKFKCAGVCVCVCILSAKSVLISSSQYFNPILSYIVFFKEDRQKLTDTWKKCSVLLGIREIQSRTTHTSQNG